MYIHTYTSMRIAIHMCAHVYHGFVLRSVIAATEIDEYFSTYTNVRVPRWCTYKRSHVATYLHPHILPFTYPASFRTRAYYTPPYSPSRFHSRHLPSYSHPGITLSVSRVPLSRDDSPPLEMAGEYVYSCGYLLVRAISIN